MTVIIINFFFKNENFEEIRSGHGGGKLYDFSFPGN
jgi:hypothetical protein